MFQEAHSKWLLSRSKWKKLIHFIGAPEYSLHIIIATEDTTILNSIFGNSTGDQLQRNIPLFINGNYFSFSLKAVTRQTLLDYYTHINTFAWERDMRDPQNSCFRIQSHLGPILFVDATDEEMKFFIERAPNPLSQSGEFDIHYAPFILGQYITKPQERDEVAHDIREESAEEESGEEDEYTDSVKIDFAENEEDDDDDEESEQKENSILLRQIRRNAMIPRFVLNEERKKNSSTFSLVSYDGVGDEVKGQCQFNRELLYFIFSNYFNRYKNIGKSDRKRKAIESLNQTVKIEGESTFILFMRFIIGILILLFSFSFLGYIPLVIFKLCAEFYSKASIVGILMVAYYFIIVIPVIFFLLPVAFISYIFFFVESIRIFVYFGITWPALRMIWQIMRNRQVLHFFSNMPFV